jgi:hypothetical protein
MLRRIALRLPVDGADVHADEYEYGIVGLHGVGEGREQGDAHGGGEPGSMPIMMPSSVAQITLKSDRKFKKERSAPPKSSNPWNIEVSSW